MKKETINDLTTEKTELKREIGAFGGVSIIAGIMIGSGIFYLGAYVLQRVGMNSGLALLCWIIGGVISLFGGLAYAEMGAAMPQSGGRVVYLNEAYHPIVGFMNGFVDWLIAGPGSVAALALALMGVFQPIFHLSDFGCKIAAVVLIFGITAYNMVGVKLASMVQNVSMIAKMVPVAIIPTGSPVYRPCYPRPVLGLCQRLCRREQHQRFQHDRSGRGGLPLGL